jgi:hypothetical protein
VTGEFFDEQTAVSLNAVLASFNPQKYDAQVLRRFAEGFGIERFKREIADFVEQKKLEYFS